MSKLIITLLAFILALGGPAAAARELGVMDLSGQLTLDWTAREDDGEGGFVGRYRLRGGTDGEGPGEALFGGQMIACVGVMHVNEALLWSDVAWCRIGDDRGNGVILLLVGEAGPWIAHSIRLCVTSGEGHYARMRGEGTALRAMHVAAGSSSPWGMFAGEMRWRLLPSGTTVATASAGAPSCPP